MTVDLKTICVTGINICKEYQRIKIIVYFVDVFIREKSENVIQSGIQVYGIYDSCDNICYKLSP